MGFPPHTEQRFDCLRLLLEARIELQKGEDGKIKASWKQER